MKKSTFFHTTASAEQEVPGKRVGDVEDGSWLPIVIIACFVPVIILVVTNRKKKNNR